MLHALRKICNHPSNLEVDKWPELRRVATSVNDADASGKTKLLQILLEQIFGQGEKVVVFCQYLRTVDIIARQVAASFGITAHTLVGQLSAAERARRVQAFQESTGPGAMVLTLGVGGTGITLHAAAHVIHFDRCYNPAREQQSSDRVHRIGQTARCVFIHRIICKGTFEERVDSILEEKRRICGLAMPSGEHWFAELSDEQLRTLFVTASGGSASCT
jgi:SNF2 family DNA or RNA helicase